MLFGLFGNLQTDRQLTPLDSAAGCPEDKMLTMLTSSSDGNNLGAAGKKAEYVLLQQCTNCT